MGPMSSLLLDAARCYLNDSAYPVPERVTRWRAFLHEVYTERERLLRTQFYQLNGFDATDDKAKRRVIDAVSLKMTGRQPTTDQERDRLTYCKHPLRPLMWIGWKPVLTPLEGCEPAVTPPTPVIATATTTTTAPYRPKVTFSLPSKPTGYAMYHAKKASEPPLKVPPRVHPSPLPEKSTLPAPLPLPKMVIPASSLGVAPKTVSSASARRRRGRRLRAALGRANTTHTEHGESVRCEVPNRAEQPRGAAAISSPSQ